MQGDEAWLLPCAAPLGQDRRSMTAGWRVTPPGRIERYQLPPAKNSETKLESRSAMELPFRTDGSIAANDNKPHARRKGHPGKIRDRTGQVFGKLTVLSLAERGVGKSRDARWLCRCECGNAKVVCNSSLLHGTRSCGCLGVGSASRCENVLRGNSRAVRMVRNARDHAKVKGIPFDLKAADVHAIQKTISVGVCELTGLPFDVEGRKGGRAWNIPSLDRKVPALGYTTSNIRVVLWGVNAALCDWGDDVFYMIAKNYIAKREAAEACDMIRQDNIPIAERSGSPPNASYMTR